jgi:hypothetical protein
MEAKQQDLVNERVQQLALKQQSIHMKEIEDKKELKERQKQQVFHH